MKKILSSIISSIVSMVMLVNILTIIHVNAAGAVYPDGWKYWQQSRQAWSGIMIGSDTVAQSGCYLMSICKMMIQAGAINDPNYTPADFINWANSAGCISSNGMVNSKSAITGYNKATKTITYIDSIYGDHTPYANSNSFHGNEGAIQDMIDLRNQGFLVMCCIKDGGHFVLVGDPTPDGDLELYGSASDSELASGDKVRSIYSYYYYEVEGERILPGSVPNSAGVVAKDEEESDENKKKAEALKNKPLYRLERFNEQQKETVAILQNKNMTENELATFKWSAIVSQFTIPYVNNMADVMKSDTWNQVYSNVGSIEYRLNPYLEEYKDRVNSSYEKGVKNYIQYLKNNEDKLREVLDNLKSDPILTPLYVASNDCATVEDLFESDAIFIHDNQALAGYSLEQEESDGELEIGSQYIIGDTETEGLQSLVDNSRVKINLWESLISMYDITNLEAHSAYDAVMESSLVQSVSVPVYVNNDVSLLYNTMFINNAKILNKNKSSFSNNYAKDYYDELLYMDQWGNICIKENNTHLVVYPSYANSLLMSSELEGSDIAGYYYENLSEQLKDYNITFDNGTKSLVSMIDDDKVVLTVDEAIKHIKGYAEQKEDRQLSLGYGSGAFLTTSLLNNAGEDTSSKVYNRLGSTDKAIPVAFFDTTTFAVGSKPMLSNYTRTTDYKEKNRDWYKELSTPSRTNGNNKYWFESIASIISKDDFERYRFSDVVVAEKFGVRTFFNKNTSNTSMFKIGEDGSIDNGQYGYILSDWVLSEDTKCYNENIVNGVEVNLDTVGAKATQGLTSLFNMPIKLPFVTYANNYSGMYIGNSTRTSLLTSSSNYRQYALKDTEERSPLSLSFTTEDCISSPLDKEYTDINMLESVSKALYYDSARFKTYFTFNTDLEIEISADGNNQIIEDNNVIGEIENAFNYTKKGKGGVGLGAKVSSGTQTPGYPYNDAKDKNIQMNSIPLLSTVVDDASSWGIWDNNASLVDTFRNEDYSIAREVGLLEPVRQNKNDSIYGIKYFLDNQIVSDVLDVPCMEDVLSIAYMWDTYYIPNSPLCTKLAVKPISDSTLYTDEELGLENVVITPYNAMHESNINTLFFMRELDDSTEFVFSNVYGENGLENSTVEFKQNVYVSNIHFPSLLLAINKNASGANLTKWVNELVDRDASSMYIMELIAAYIEHPITGIKNFLIGIAQWIHVNISKGTIGSFMNIEVFADLLWGEYGFLFYTLYGIVVSVAIAMIWFRYLKYKEHTLKYSLLKCKDVIILGIIPIVLFSYVGSIFSFATTAVLNTTTDKIVVTDLEAEKRGSSKIQFGYDEDDILLDGFSYRQEELKDLTLKMMVGKDNFNNPVYKYVSLQDLYDSICIENKSYKTNDNDFGGLDAGKGRLWYNTEEFVPVNYDKYDDSVFYYFYDVLKSNYVRYYADNALMQSYDKIDVNSSVSEDAYFTTMQNAEEEWRNNFGGLKTMYTDVEYLYRSDDNGIIGMNDILGLSRLFNMTDTVNNSSGMYPVPNKNYTENCNLEDWATKCDNSTLLEFTSYTDYRNKAKEDSSYEIECYPLAGLIKSDYWELYSMSSAICRGNKYYFTPDYLQDFSEQHDQGDYDYSSASETGIAREDGDRAPWRTYGTRAMLNSDVTDTKLQSYTRLEIALSDLNDKCYHNFCDTLDELSDSNITDDTILFAQALYATFEFNKAFSNLQSGAIEPQGIDTSSLSTDKLFKIIYSDDIGDIIDNPNLIYMVADDGGFVTSLVFSFAEVILVITMYLRAIIYIVVMVSSFIICLTYIIRKENSFRDSIIGLVTHFISLIVGQFAVLSVFKFGVIMLSDTDSDLVKFFYTVVLVAVNVALLKWHLKLFKSLIKNIGNCGGAFIKDAVTKIQNNFKFGVMIGRASIVKKQANVIADPDSGNSPDNVKEDARDQRRKRVIDRVDNTENSMIEIEDSQATPYDQDATSDDEITNSSSGDKESSDNTISTGDDTNFNDEDDNPSIRETNLLGSGESKSKRRRSNINNINNKKDND